MTEDLNRRWCECHEQKSDLKPKLRAVEQILFQLKPNLVSPWANTALYISTRSKIFFKEQRRGKSEPHDGKQAKNFL